MWATERTGKSPDRTRLFQIRTPPDYSSASRNPGGGSNTSVIMYCDRSTVGVSHRRMAAAVRGPAPGTRAFGLIGGAAVDSGSNAGAASGVVDPTGGASGTGG